MNEDLQEQELQNGQAAAEAEMYGAAQAAEAEFEAAIPRFPAERLHSLVYGTPGTPSVVGTSFPEGSNEHTTRGWTTTGIRYVDAATHYRELDDHNNWVSGTAETLNSTSKRKAPKETSIPAAPVDWDEVDLRCKAIEATCKAFGTRQVDLQEFSDLLDQFYIYIKTGKKFAI